MDTHFLDKKHLQDLYTYDPETGEVRNRTTRHKAPGGELAGCIASGRVRLRVHGEPVRGADVVWTMMHGSIPEGLCVGYENWALKGYDSLRASNLYLCTRDELMLSHKHGCRISAQEAAAHRAKSIKRQRHINPDSGNKPTLGRPVFVLGRPPE